MITSSGFIPLFLLGILYPIPLRPFYQYDPFIISYPNYMANGFAFSRGYGMAHPGGLMAPAPMAPMQPQPAPEIRPRSF
jgi:hypothetical protein